MEEAATMSRDNNDEKRAERDEYDSALARANDESPSGTSDTSVEIPHLPKKGTIPAPLKARIEISRAIKTPKKAPARSDEDRITATKTRDENKENASEESSPDRIAPETNLVPLSKIKERLTSVKKKRPTVVEPPSLLGCSSPSPALARIRERLNAHNMSSHKNAHFMDHVADRSACVSPERNGRSIKAKTLCESFASLNLGHEHDKKSSNDMISLYAHELVKSEMNQVRLEICEANERISGQVARLLMSLRDQFDESLETAKDAIRREYNEKLATVAREKDDLQAALDNVRRSESGKIVVENEPQEVILSTDDALENLDDVLIESPFPLDCANTLPQTDEDDFSYSSPVATVGRYSDVQDTKSRGSNTPVRRSTRVRDSLSGKKKRLSIRDEDDGTDCHDLDKPSKDSNANKIYQKIPQSVDFVEAPVGENVQEETISI